MSERGFTVLEALLAVGIVTTMLAVCLPVLEAWSVDSELLAAADRFKGEFRRAHSMAIRSGEYTAIRFEDGPRGPVFSVYRDGDHDGVRSVDIAAGRDPRLAGPFPLDAGLRDSDRVIAYKHLAFINCAEGRERLCREHFIRALTLDPRMELAPAEAGHPVWGPVYRAVKAGR